MRRDAQLCVSTTGNKNKEKTKINKNTQYNEKASIKISGNSDVRIFCLKGIGQQYSDF